MEAEEGGDDDRSGCASVDVRGVGGACLFVCASVCVGYVESGGRGGVLVVYVA